MDTFTAIAFLFGIAAILSFVNDRYLHIQHDTGLLILACVTTALLRIFIGAACRFIEVTLVLKKTCLA